MATPERWLSVCSSLRLQSGPALDRAITSLRDELSTWPASVRHLDEKDAWLEGIFEGKRDPRLELVGHASIRQKGQSSYSGFALSEMLEIIRAFAHHLDPSFDPPNVVLEDESNFVSAYGCGGGGATKKIGSEQQWCRFNSTGQESPSMGMRTDDAWDVHGLSVGTSVSIAASEFTDDFEFSASGPAPAIFELATVWTEVKNGATGDRVRELLAADRRTRSVQR